MLDETTFAIPEDWWEHIHPRHGGWLQPAVTGDPQAAAFLDAELTKALPRWQTTFTNPATDAALVTQLQAYVAGTVTPVGAAVAVNLILRTYPDDERDALGRRFADAWAARHGLTFAAQAAAELGRVDLEADDRTVGTREVAGPWVLRYRQPGAEFWFWPVDSIIERTRELLAVASDQDYAAAVEELGAHRVDHLTRLVVSFLAPTRQDWVDELCATGVARRGPGGEWSMVLCSLGDVRQLDEITFVST